MTAPAVLVAGASQRWTIASQPIDVHWATLDVTPEKLTALRATLTPEERHDGARQRHEPQRFIAARGLVREILARRLETDPGRLRLGRTPHGKLYIADPPVALAFNVSHAAEWLLVAVAPRGAVGADVERVRADVDCETVARHVFGGSELVAFHALPPGERRRAFFACWARKEACLKAIGTGLSIAPESVEVGFGDEPVAVRIAHAEWCVQGIPTPRRDLVAAIAIRI